MASDNSLDVQKTKSSSFRTALPRIASFLLIIIIDSAFIWLLIRLISLNYYPLAAVIAGLLIFTNIVILRKEAYPVRWMLVGLVFMTLFTIYPIFFTVWVSSTNYGEGHLVNKEQAIAQILQQKYLPETGTAYTWTAFKLDTGEYSLWLQDAAKNGYLAKPGEPLTQPQPGEAGVGEFDSKGIQKTIEGYTRLNAIIAATDQNLTEIKFGPSDKSIQIRSPQEAAEYQQLYVYDPNQDAMINQETGVMYQNIRGTYSSPSGEEIRPGFVVSISIANFSRFFTSPALRGPLVRIILWNFAFAFFSLLLNFSLGLAIAILYNNSHFPFKRSIRSLLIIPYTIPALLTILIWRAMLNPDLGVISGMLDSIFHWHPQWFSNEWWAKVAILLVNLWLSYPYFMLICSGALQSISEDYYHAAQVDGANFWQQFRHITFPLLLVAVGPLLIASFVFNFNNFNLIYLYNIGGPPIASTPTPAGHTDILISYVYNLAFTGTRGFDYGFAAAITIVIFLIVGAITLFQFRYTRMWEEVSENA